MENKSAGLIDTDPQGTVALWAKQHPARYAPTVVHIGSGTVDGHLATFRNAGADLVAIDTPPNVAPILANVAARQANSVLIVCGVYGEDPRAGRGAGRHGDRLGEAFGDHS